MEEAAKGKLTVKIRTEFQDEAGATYSTAFVCFCCSMLVETYLSKYK